MSDPDRGRARWTLLALAALALLHLGNVVPRLSNSWYGDVEFSGWSTVPTQRWLAGEAPYGDFLLPIPPGSFLAVAAAQRLVGEPRLLTELWLCGACHLLMAVVAYATLVRLGSRTLALAASAATLAQVLQFNKECLYDHTAQVVAWTSLAVGVRALLAAGPATGLWLATGFLAGFTHLFKQSTGVGIMAGWVLGLGYAAWVSLRRTAAARLTLRPALLWAAGAAAGLGATVATVAAMGGSVPGWFHAVYVEGPALKGGTGHLVAVLLSYVATLAALPATLGVLLTVVVLGWRGLASAEGTALALEHRRRGELSRGAAVALVAAVAAVVAVVALLFRARVDQLPAQVLRVTDGLKALPSLSLPLLMVAFLLHLRRPADDADGRQGHVINTLALVAGVASLLHNTSAPEFRAFYDNNALVFLGLWVVLTLAWRVRPILGVAVLALALSTVFSNKLQRTLAARRPVLQGYWAGLRVNPRGASMLEVGEVVRRHSAPGERVLVIPDDLALSPTFDRPRPRLRGAVLFVDQYPSVAVAEDLARLAADPPRVVVVHPAEAYVWRNLYRVWSADSPAERVQRVVLDQLPAHYERVHTRPTAFLQYPTSLEVWVRREGAAPAPPAPAPPPAAPAL